MSKYQFKYNDYINDLVAIFDCNDKLICKTRNEYRFLDILSQIKEQKINGCYLKINGNRYDVNSMGHVVNPPQNLFPHLTSLLRKLTDC